jgi:hypothetical protein
MKEKPMDESSKLLLMLAIPTVTASIGMVVNYRKVRQIKRHLSEQSAARG